MEYTKDITLYVNYGQGIKTRKFESVFYKLLSVIARHKIMSTVISVTIILMFVELVLVNSFIKILSSMTV